MKGMFRSIIADTARTNTLNPASSVEFRRHFRSVIKRATWGKVRVYWPVYEKITDGSPAPRSWPDSNRLWKRSLELFLWLGGWWLGGGLLVAAGDGLSVVDDGAGGAEALVVGVLDGVADVHVLGHVDAAA